MNRVLESFLNGTIRKGALEVISADGRSHTYGDGNGDKVRVRFTSAEAERGVILNPELKIGEAFVDGGYVIEEGSVYDFLALILSNVQSVHPRWWMGVLAGLRYVTRRLRQLNPPARARKNIHHHYDLDGRLYSLFLDNDLQYSCAYFEDGNSDLDVAQLAKKRHSMAKLAVEPGQRVLDIGSGWGGLGALHGRARRYRRDRRDAFGRAARRFQPRAPASAACRIACASFSRTTARSRGRSTASYRSACSSMSASAIIANSSAPAAIC